MAPILPLLIGLGVSRAADQEAETRRQKLLDAMQAYQVDKAQKGQAEIQQLIATQRPDVRKAELDKITAARADSLASSVQAVQPTNPAPIAGKLSSDYQKSQEGTASTVAERTRRAIEQMSIMGAPGERDFANSVRFGHTAADVDSANTAINNVGQAYQTSMRNTVPNPWLKLAGQVMMAYGSAKLGANGDPGVGTGIDSGPYEDASGNLYNNGAPSQYGRGTQKPTVRSGVKSAYSLWGTR